MSTLPALIDLAAPDEDDILFRLLGQRVPWILHGRPYSRQLYGATGWPSQGWKLHVSATPLSAAEVLERALPVLLREGVRFKVINSRRRLIGLNVGAYGATQVGKFITVFPPDDATAVRLAAALHDATAGLRGPRVPTDRPLCPGSLVHYRYGAFRPLWDAGARRPYDLLDVEGRLTVDERLQSYVPPRDRRDPFLAAGVAVTPAPRSGPFAGRFLILEALQTSWRGGVFCAIDLGLQPARPCLLKEFWRDVGTDPYGRDIAAWAENEAGLLQRLEGCALVPDLYGSLAHDGNHYLSIEYIEGESLASKVAALTASEQPASAETLLTIACNTAAPLALLHERGIVHRDVKPENFIVTPAGTYRLIDFGLAHGFQDDTSPPLGMGTPLYVSPEQFRGASPHPADDVFAWGAMLHHIAAGDRSIETALAPGREVAPFPRVSLRELRPDLPVGLVEVIDRTLAWDGSDRFASLRTALAALGAVDAEAPRRSRHAVRRRRAPRGTGDCAQVPPLEAAMRIGSLLCDLAQHGAAGLRWPAGGQPSEGEWATPDLYDGAAGTAWFLAELAAATGEDRFAATARGAAQWLAGPTWAEGRAERGLHSGEDGIGLLFLQLAERLHEPGFRAAAELRARRSRTVPFRTLDLVAGAAGAAIFLVRLARETGVGDYLEDARQIGDLLIAAARRRPGQPGCYWEVPVPPFTGRSLPYLGLLHGAAGIGLALASVGEATSDDRYTAMAHEAGEMLLRQASDSPKGGLRWGRVLDGDPADLQAHCHGAGGIGQFLLRLCQTTGDRRFQRAVIGAAETISAGSAQRTEPGLCHGLAGDGSFLLDCYQAFGDRHYLNVARACGERLQADFVGEGQSAAQTVHSGRAPHSLMLGSAGVGSFFLRLAQPKSAPDGLLGACSPDCHPA